MEEPLKMDDPLTLFPAEELPAEPAAAPRPDDPRALARRGLLRRLLALLAVGVAGFALTTWLLVRVENPARLFGFAKGPAGVVRAHLDALNSGELRTAYDLLSQHYRAQVPFEAFHALVTTHWRMFRTRKVVFRRHEESQHRAVLETHMISADGERYVARFTLVQSDGQWWIDDIRWGIDSGRHGSLLI